MMTYLEEEQNPLITIITSWPQNLTLSYQATIEHSVTHCVFDVCWTVEQVFLDT